MSNTHDMRRSTVLLSCLVLLLSVLPAAAQPSGDGALVFAPAGLSVDQYDVITTPEVVEVEAHDGVVLHTRVYRPDTGGVPTPVILVHSPYYNGLLLGDDTRSLDLVEFFTPKGYTVVLSDLRGTGNSGGCGEQDGPNQAKDFATLVEHFADQPWSSGKVGSYGKSYDAETQHAGAVLDPRGLETMVSVAGIAGLYDVAYFDGVPLALNGVLSAAAYELYDLDVPGDVGAMPRRFERHTCQPENFANGADPRGDMTDYWAEREFRAGVDDITASMLMVTGLQDFTVSPINLDGWFDEIPTFRRAIIGQWPHKYPYDAADPIARDDWYDTIHAWFDHELMGLNTGITEWPEVQVQDEDNAWRAVDSFRGMGSEVELPLGEDTVTFGEDGEWSVDLPTPSRHLSGQAYLDAVIALDRPDGHFAVRLDEVRSSGQTRQLVRGYLSAVHRESLLNPIPVTPDHPTPYRIRTYPFDATLDEGSTLRLTIAGSDSATLPAGTGYTATIDLSRSVLRVPVADDRCGLAVATREAAGPTAGCPHGVPVSTAWTDVPRSFGHNTTARVIGTSVETIGGVDAVREWGYLTMRDGVELAFEVVRPDDDQPHPTLFTYDGYAAGADPDAGYAERYLPDGYALLGVNLRGTSCSGGTFDFFQPAEAHDGYEVVEWAATQPWSTGRVGMIGKSYPGITQLFVAETQPPHLAAISPGHYYADVYRDIANPGGIPNYAFAALWSFISQPGPGVLAAPGESLAGDATCLVNQRHHATNAPDNPLLQAETHPHEVMLHAERSPLTHADRIDVPVYQALSWQDEQLMSRNTHFLATLDELGVPYRAVLSNGDHGTYREGPQMAELDRFLEAHLVAPEVLADGTLLEDYLAEPSVSVFWEQGETTAPRWVTELDGWGDQAVARVEPLSADGGLGGPTVAGSTSWLHNAAGTQGIADGTTLGSDYQTVTTWDRYSPPPGTFVAFTSLPYTEDVALLGSASADLWLTATAPNVDLQVTLTEVRADGTEVFVNQGWLRASQRQLDRARSTALLPVHTHREADVAPLSMTEPSLVRVEVLPFGHVVREGSRLRMWVEAPTAVPQLEGFQLDPTPARVTIHSGADFPSALVLPVAVSAPVPQVYAGQAGQPACGVSQRNHCRTDPLA